MVLNNSSAGVAVVRNDGVALRHDDPDRGKPLVDLPNEVLVQIAALLSGNTMERPWIDNPLGRRLSNPMGNFSLVSHLLHANSLRVLFQELLKAPVLHACPGRPLRVSLRGCNSTHFPIPGLLDLILRNPRMANKVTAVRLRVDKADEFMVHRDIHGHFLQECLRIAAASYFCAARKHLWTQSLQRGGVLAMGGVIFALLFNAREMDVDMPSDDIAGILRRRQTPGREILRHLFGGALPSPSPQVLGQIDEFPHLHTIAAFSGLHTITFEGFFPLYDTLPFIQALPPVDVLKLVVHWSSAMDGEDPSQILDDEELSCFQGVRHLVVDLHCINIRGDRATDEWYEWIEDVLSMAGTYLTSLKKLEIIWSKDANDILVVELVEHIREELPGHVLFR